jgi:hypothetical protein
MFALNGLLKEANGDYADVAMAELSYSLADAMLEARNTDEELGIAALKPKRKYARKEA